MNRCHDHRDQRRSDTGSRPHLGVVSGVSSERFFIADLADQLPVCSACFYSPDSIVKPRGVQFTVIKQVASDTDLIRPCDCPSVDGSITRVVRGKPHAETVRKASEAFGYPDIAERPTLGADPQRIVPPAAQNSWSHDVKVKRKIWMQNHWYFELQPLFCLGLLPWHDNEPPVPFQNKVAANFERSKVFRSEWREGDKAKHETVSEADRSADVEFRVQPLLRFVHPLQSEL